MLYDDEAIVTAVTRRALAPTPDFPLTQPVTIVLEHVHEFSPDSYYYRAEILELSEQKIYYPGVGRSEDEAIADIFRSLLIMVKIQAQLWRAITNPLARSNLRARRAQIQRYITLPDTIDEFDGN